MRRRWRQALVVAALVTTVVIIPSLATTTTSATADDGNSSPTTYSEDDSSDTTYSNDSSTPTPDDSSASNTPAPVTKVEETPSPTEAEETDPPETPAPSVQEDTPSPVSPYEETPSPTEEEDTPETPSPVVVYEPETPAPTAPTEEEVGETEPLETPSPTEEETPETPSPVEPETPRPTEAEAPETEAPVVPTPKPLEEVVVTPTPQSPTPEPTPEPIEPLTPEPTVRWTFAPADPWTESPEAPTPSPAEETSLATVTPDATDTPVAIETLGPVPPENASPAPLVPEETDAPVSVETSAPVAIEPLAPVPPEKASSAPVFPEETNAPVTAETLAPVAIKTLAPVPPEDSVAPAVPDTEAPVVAMETLAPAVEVAITESPVAAAMVPLATDVTPAPTVKQTWAPADPWTASPDATPAPQREWTPPPTVKQTWAPADPWTASPDATPAPQREWTPPPTEKQTWAPVAPWTASPEWTPPPTEKQTWAPAAPWTASPGATWAPVAPWTAAPGATFAPVAPWTASPGATPAPTRAWTASPGATFAPVAPWTASPGATWAPVVPWTASPGATWAPAVPWTAAPGATWAPVVPWTGPPTIALLDLVATIKAANTAGEFEGQFDTILAGLEYAGLTTLLEGKALMTAFLPTDDAFEAEGITESSVTTLPKPVVQSLLRYHLLEGAVSKEVLADAADLYTVLKVTLDVERDGTLVDGEGNAREVVGEELRANNGYAHAVDGVLYPPDLLSLAHNVNAEGGSFEGVFDIFLAGVARTGLEPMLTGVDGLYTVFAPGDFAFESVGITNETILTFDRDILSSILSYHVVANEAVDNSTLNGPLREFSTLLSGSTLRNAVDGGVLDATQMKANILAADLQAVNGYLHAIDIVLEPYPLFTQSPTAAPTAAPTYLSLVDTLVAENADSTGAYFGQFDTMIAALSASNLDIELAGPLSFTVFAPTSAAFAAAGVGPDNVDSIPPSILENLLKYHTLPGGVARSAIAREDTLFTTLKVGLETSGATLIDSQGIPVNIVEADVECSNGYLHYVDGVLMPPDLMTSLESYNEPGGSYEGVFDTFVRAMDITNMSGEYKGLNGPYTIFAPTDSAFAELRLNASNIDRTNRSALSELMQYHVLEGEMEIADLEGRNTFRTLDYAAAGSLMTTAGGQIVDTQGGQAEVLVGDLSSSNGVLHGIDGVLMPFAEEQLTGDMFPASEARSTPIGSGNDNVEVAALSAGVAAAVILIAAAVAVHKRRQADAVKPPQVAPDEDGWSGGDPVRGAAIHPA
eukprot:g11796.t2